MKKSNLAILLLAPFVIAFLGIVSVSAAFSTIDKDIDGINWDYNDREAFKISSTGYLLKATPVYESGNGNLAYGNDLVWQRDEEGSKYASLEKKENSYYLYAKKEGTFSLTCRNRKGNVHRTRQAVCYDKAAILFLPEIPTSQNNLDSTTYYGQYDFDEDLNKKPASFIYKTQVIPNNLSSTLRISSKSDNIDYDVSSGKVMVKDKGEAYLTRSCGYSSEDSKESTLSFDIVAGGVNVYDYKQLRACTNDSQEGEPVVLRKNFESLKNTYQIDNKNVVYKDNKPVLKSENTTLFGYYDKEKGISFNPYIFTRDDSHEFVDKWNENCKSNTSLKERDANLIAAIHVQKSFYGNGYKRNFHDLIYPSKSKTVTVNGVNREIPALGQNDLYKGPSYSYALGDPKNRALIAVYGQDNVGRYVNKDNVTIDDVDIKNCDTPSSLSFLKTCGSVMDIEGDNVSLLYSRLSCGKNVLRVFQSRNTLVQNCLLSNARNFLIDTGTNDYVKLDGSKTNSFLGVDGTTTTRALDDYLNGPGDDLRGSAYFSGSGDSASLKKALDSLWQGRRQTSEVENNYKGTRTIDNCYFYRSGIASIGVESVFEGPFRYNNTPSVVRSFRNLFSSRQVPGASSSSRIPYIPNGRFGISYPVSIKVKGKTRFYDYKEVSQMDITGLIEEHFSSLLSSLPEQLREKIYQIFGRSSSGDKNIEISIDDFFPIKPAIEQLASKEGCYYSGKLPGSEEEKKYRNLPVAYYGGGVNLSSVDRSERDGVEHYESAVPLDLIEYYINHGSGVRGRLYKIVSFFTGFEPFHFTRQKADGEWFGQAPNVSELKK